MLLNSKAEQKSAGVRLSGSPDRGGAADCPTFAFFSVSGSFAASHSGRAEVCMKKTASSKGGGFAVR